MSGKIELAEFNMSAPDRQKTIKFERKERTHDSVGLKLPPGIIETEVTIVSDGATLSYWLPECQAPDIARLVLGQTSE